MRIPERRATRSLDRLTDGGLLAVVSDSAPRALRSYRLALAAGGPKQTSGS
ncbi:hypothetical protein ACWDAO_25305 [Streptomyces sp. NPDC001212]